MAFGDTGCAATELILTCSTPKEGAVNIEKGDAVVLTGNYEVSTIERENDPIFGVAMADATTNRAAIPVQVRGICVFNYEGTKPLIDGCSGVLSSSLIGYVRAPDRPVQGTGSGIIVKVDTDAEQVHVLL